MTAPKATITPAVTPEGTRVTLPPRRPLQRRYLGRGPDDPDRTQPREFLVTPEGQVYSVFPLTTYQRGAAKGFGSSTTVHRLMKPGATRDKVLEIARTLRNGG